MTSPDYIEKKLGGSTVFIDGADRGNVAQAALWLIKHVGFTLREAKDFIFSLPSKQP